MGRGSEFDATSSPLPRLRDSAMAWGCRVYRVYATRRGVQAIDATPSRTSPPFSRPRPSASPEHSTRRATRVVFRKKYANRPLKAFESRRSGLRWALGSMAKPVSPDAPLGEVWRCIYDLLRDVGVAKLSRRESKSIIRDYFQESIPLVSRTRRARNELWQTYRYDVSPTRPEGGVTGRRVP